MKPININKNFINTPQTYFSEAPLISPVSAATREFVEKLSNSTTEVITEFLKKNAKPVKVRSEGDELYRYNNLLLMRTNGNKAAKLEENVEQMKSSGLAPKFVQYFQLGKDDFLTILEADGERLLSYTKNAAKIPPQIKQIFKDKVQKLAARGIINREIFANKDALLITQDGKKIIFGDWCELSPISPAEQQIFHKIISKWQI